MDSPCLECVDDATCGDACEKYMYFLAHTTGENINTISKKSANLIREAVRDANEE
jgi:hypothetical protein